MFIVVVTALDLLELNETLESILYGAAYLSLPVAIGIAVFRYRLYEIDRIVNRTVTYAVVVVALAAVYLGGVAALGALVGKREPACGCGGHPCRRRSVHAGAAVGSGLG